MWGLKKHKYSAKIGYNQKNICFESNITLLIYSYFW